MNVCAANLIAFYINRKKLWDPRGIVTNAKTCASIVSFCRYLLANLTKFHSNVKLNVHDEIVNH